MPSFVTPPAPRLHYEADGTQVLVRKDNVGLLATLSSAQAAKMNDEDNDTYSFGENYAPADGSNVKYLIFLFPEPRNILGCYITGGNFTTTQLLEYSTDTTTGVDGTWSVAIAAGNWTSQAGVSNTIYRLSWTALNLANVKGLRWRTQDSGSYTFVYGFHIYGTKNTDAGLSFRHPTVDQALAVGDMDFGDVALGQTYTKTFRVKNNHATQQANGVTITAPDQSWSGAWQFEIGGGGFASSLNIGDLAAGATSGVITIRRVVPGGDTANRAQHGRLSAVATSWT